MPYLKKRKNKQSVFIGLAVFAVPLSLHLLEWRVHSPVISFCRVVGSRMKTDHSVDPQKRVYCSSPQKAFSLVLIACPSQPCLKHAQISAGALALLFRSVTPGCLYIEFPRTRYFLFYVFFFGCSFNINNFRPLLARGTIATNWILLTCCFFLPFGNIGSAAFLQAVLSLARLFHTFIHRDRSLKAERAVFSPFSKRRAK